MGFTSIQRIRIRLDVHRTLDLEAIERGQTIFAYRCFARLRFGTSRGWSEERFAILDTGAPFSVIPSTLVRDLDVTRLFPTQLRGLIPKASASLRAQVAKVTCVLTDERGVSPALELIALLAEASDVPLILGWSGCLDRARLVLDPRQGEAFLEV